MLSMKKIIIVIISLFGCIHVYSQGPLVKDNFPVTMAAGNQYKASGWKSLWWGKHYRKEWTTPVSFPVLHLATFGGGLKPVKVGGGHQSKTLRLLSADGKEYVLRTID